jgi:hypothetical protein
MVEFTKEELDVLVQLMDAGVRSIGLNAVPGANAIIYKLNKAYGVQPELETPEDGEAP